jgi:hypothetical protein
VKVLVVLEDPTLDQYVVKPVIECVFSELGRPARVDVLWDPHLHGVIDLLGSVDEVIDDHPMVDLFVFVVDRDCDRENLTTKLRDRIAAHTRRAVGCLAVEETEVWMLAAQRTPPAPWTEIRRECDPKERYAEPWLLAQGYGGADLGRGRKSAMRALTGNFRRVLSRCPEIQALRRELADRFGAT